MHVVKKTENVAVITVDPALAHGGREQLESLRQLCADLLEEGYTRLVLDLSGIGHAPSLVLGNIIVLQKRVKMQNGELAILNPSSMLRRILAITEMDKILPIYHDEGQAVRAVGGTA